MPMKNPPHPGLSVRHGGGAETWFRLQAAYDLAQAMRHADRIKVERFTPAA
jgi:plasmid maintenance system antidote protein VapI